MSINDVDSAAGQVGGFKNWEKTAERQKNAPEATDQRSRGADEDRKEPKPVRTESVRSLKK